MTTREKLDCLLADIEEYFPCTRDEQGNCCEICPWYSTKKSYCKAAELMMAVNDFEKD